MIIMMKPTLHYGLFLLFFFLFFQVFSSKLEARPLITHQEYWMDPLGKALFFRKVVNPPSCWGWRNAIVEMKNA
ncbi:hypothetical protein Ahy_A08g039445 isoform A [Arachis hypogaea]|uniref:Uncharacterized protein n=1 Tax=Arachis hypogaea TaxID=3818 RepID=A0A445BWB9_ARAHY|nr:hypothetical protein Ahy_A08g039445 isoform A [Arachis hypogaea]